MKIQKILTAVALSLVLAGCNNVKNTINNEEAKSENAKNEIKFYNWGEYIGPDVIENFEKQYDAHVICEYFDSNEMMYTKLLAGESYDVLVPSDYMIERLIKEDMIQPINKDVVTNLELVTDNVKNLDYDKGNVYSAPYFYGSVGIVYDTTKVDKNEIETKGWDILKEEKFKGEVYMYDSERDTFMVALKALGYSMNTENEEEIEQAYQWLLDQKEKVSPSYVTDEVIDDMANGAKALAVVYSGDAAYILEDNPDMEYWAPTQGTNIWSDGMVIPKNAGNPELANKFINYMLEYEPSLSNTQEVGYSSPNKEVFEEMVNGEFKDNSAYRVRTDNKNDEVFHDNEKLRTKLSDLLIKIKA